MKVLEYEFRDSDWDFSKVLLQDTNLFVGDSGTGKTRFLNTLFNLGTAVAQRQLVSEGEWHLKMTADEHVYRWDIKLTAQVEKGTVSEERLYCDDSLILTRDGDVDIFNNTKLPRLAKDELSVSILREEEIVKPIYDGFCKMMRRRFFEGEMSRSSSLIPSNTKRIDSVGVRRDLNDLYRANFPLNPKLYALSKYFPDIFSEVTSIFVETFDFINEVDLRDSGEFRFDNAPDGLPIFAIKERNIHKWIPLSELSSGIQKVLLIITDLLTLPPGSIYLIDEYENSLGVGAIDFLPELLASREFPIQVFITSHHPYIIRSIPISHWYVTHRHGSKVQFSYGNELIQRYSLSSQDKYIQLLNDPYYNEGIE